MSAAARRIGLYALDQDLRTTRTLGVSRYTQRLLAELARLPDPGFELLVWVTDANAADLEPPAIPPWMRFVRRRGSYGRGLRRLWADHVLAAWLPRRARVDAVHYPKGWLPLQGLGPVRTIVTLHDTIPTYYRHRRQGYGSRLHWRYFDWILRRSARRADLVLTPSQASADSLRALVPGIARLLVMPTGSFDVPPASAPLPRGDALLVLGSTAPHKATAQTLALLEAYAQARRARVPVVLVGVPEVASIPDAPATPHLELRVEGRVPRERLAELLRTSRALVLLSEVEGFGLPLLEAYAAGTPVCYRRASSMAEILAGAPGGWDGVSADTFFQALDEVLAMSPHQIQEVGAGLRRRYDFPAAVAQLAGVYRSLVEEPGAARARRVAS